MSDQSLTHKDLATMLDVSETTIKSYRRKFEDCIPVASRGKPIRFTPEAGEVCLRIRDLFAEGMSIPEVRARLAEEFSWISLVAREKKEAEPSPVALPHEFTIGISNLAKSMVTLTQQQGSILKRLQEMEENVASLSLSGTAKGSAEGGEGIFVASGTGISVDREELSALLRPLARLDILDNLSGLDGLASVGALTDALHQATGALTEAAQALQEAAQKLTDSETALAERMRLLPQGEGPGQEADSSPSRVVRFPGTSDTTGGQAHAPGAVSTIPQEQPPRHLLTLPMVFRTADGTFLPAGGRARGPFSINDLKAILAYGKRPPEHYTMHWERASGGWWLVLEQPQAAAPRPLRLMLRELASQRGMSVAELVQFIDCDENAQPAQFSVFVDSLTAALGSGPGSNEGNDEGGE